MDTYKHTHTHTHTHIHTHTHTQKQHLEVFLKMKCSERFRKIQRKTPVLEPLFNKVAGIKMCNFIKETLSKVFPVNFVKFLRTPSGEIFYCYKNL